MNTRYALKNIYLALRKSLLSILCKADAGPVDQGKVISIVVIRIDRIGDMVVSLPAIKALKEIFPGCRLSVLLAPAHAALLKDSPWIDELIPYRGFFRSAGVLRRKRFFLAIDLLMDYTLKTALLAYLSRARLTAGFDIEARGCLFDLKFKPGLRKMRMGECMLELVRFLAKKSGKSPDAVRAQGQVLSVSRENMSFADKFLARHGIERDEAVFGIHPGGNFPSQCWELRKFAELAERISRKYKARIVILASAGERKLVSRLVSLMKTQPALVAAGFPLDKTAAIISRMTLLICNNSGPLHIAAALGVPTVSTMGPTDPDLWAPEGSNHIVIRVAPDCSPCNRPFCRGHECLKAITVEKMEKAVDTQMQTLWKK